MWPSHLLSKRIEWADMAIKTSCKLLGLGRLTYRGRTQFPQMGLQVLSVGIITKQSSWVLWLRGAVRICKKTSAFKEQLCVQWAWSSLLVHNFPPGCGGCLTRGGRATTGEDGPVRKTSPRPQGAGPSATENHSEPPVVSFCSLLELSFNFSWYLCLDFHVVLVPPRHSARPEKTYRE